MACLINRRYFCNFTLVIGPSFKPNPYHTCSDYSIRIGILRLRTYKTSLVLGSFQCILQLLITDLFLTNLVALLSSVHAAWLVSGLKEDKISVLCSAIKTGFEGW
jgi:hypothetical protein